MRIKRPINRILSIALGLIGVLALMSIYSYLSYRQHIINPSDTSLPNMTQLQQGVVDITRPRENSLKPTSENEKTFWTQLWKTWLAKDVYATYSRLLIGLVVGCGISVVLGVAMGCFEPIASLFLPLLSFLSKVPGTAMLAVFFVLSGTGETMFIAMIAFGVLPILTQSIYLAARDDLHHEEIDKAYTLGASSPEVIWEVVWPQIIPKVLDNIRLQLGPAMVYLIAAEMLVGQVGMGYQIRMQQRQQHMNIVYAYIFILGTTGLLMDKGMSMFCQWYCPWFSRGKK